MQQSKRTRAARQLRSSPRSHFAVVGVAFGLAVVGACTTFNGISDITGTNPVDGSIDTSTDASSDGQIVTVDAGAGFLSLEDAVKFCVNAFNCPNLGLSTIESIDVPVDTQHFSSCVDWMAGPLPPDRIGVDQAAQFLQCAAVATTCEAAGNCMWFDLIAANDPRCNGVDSGPLNDAGYDPGTCENDGGDIIYCNAQYISHCSNAYWTPGSTCLKGSDGLNNCGVRGACGSTGCTGSILGYCGVDGHHVGYNCAIGGFTCGTDSTSDTDCLTNGTYRGCTTVATTCSGDAVSLCDGEYQSSYDCAAAGATCDSTYTPRCKLPTDTCSPASPGIDTCSGNVISLCSGGQPVSFDCSTIGLTCVAGSAAGVSGHCG